jgi:hypothetical protein
MARAPKPVQWVKYEAGAVLLELVRVSPAAELAHRRLADYYWQTGQWPTEGRGSTAALCRVSKARWPAIVAELAQLGWRTTRGRICHSGVHRVRAEAVAFLSSAESGGRKGAERRWRKSTALAEPSSPDGPPNGSANSPPNGDPTATPIPINSNSDSTSTVHNAVNLNDHLVRIGSLPKGRGKAEKEFLSDVADMFKLWAPGFATEELQNWGGWWRNRFREQPAKARRMVGELASMIREGRITDNPGSAATDLWKRLP